MAAAGGDLEQYIGAFDGTGGGGSPDGDANLYFSSRTYNQARGYLYYDSVASELKIWDGAAWQSLGASSSPWTRDGSGFIYPTTVTDDLYIGGSTPNGVWFDDGDMVLGAAAMSGTEVLRVVGDARVEGKLTVTGLVDPTGMLFDGQASAPAVPAADEGLIWVNDAVDPTVLMFTDDAGVDFTLGGIGIPNVDQVLFVNKASPVPSSPDGSWQAPYNSINSAIGAANALSPGTSNRIAIIILPGVYSEAVVTQDDFVSLIGWNKTTTIIQQAGASSPLTVAHRNLTLKNLTFEADTGCTTYIVNVTGIADDLVIAEDCDFLGTAGNANNYFRNVRGQWIFSRCRFIQSDTTLDVYYDQNVTTELDHLYDCEIHGRVYLLSTGGHDIEFHDCYLTSTTQNASTFGTVFNNGGGPRVDFYNCVIENTQSSTPGFAVWVNGGNATGWGFFGCRLLTNVNAAYDMHGQSNLTNVVMSGTTMSHGMSSRISTANRVKYAGGRDGDLDWHADIEEAVNSLTTSDDGCIIYMLDDYSADTQVQQDVDITVTIDGQHNTWTDTVPASGFTILATTGVLVLKRINFVGATVTCQGAGTKLYVDNCDIRGNVYQRGVGDDSSTRTVIHDCSVVSTISTIPGALVINSAAPTIVVSNSYLKGYNSLAGYAVDFNLVDNDNLKIQHSTLMHGQLGSNNPFGNPPAAGSIDYVAHHCTLNQEPTLVDNTKFTNLIDPAQRFNTIDADGDFGFRDNA